MAFIRLSRFKANAEVVSSILNWVCPNVEEEWEAAVASSSAMVNVR